MSVVVWSGGMDSTVLLWQELASREGVSAVSVDYGQRHRRELDCARAMAKRYGIEHVVVDLAGLRDVLPGSALTDDSVAVPEGHYADPSMRATVVPNRNAILLSVAMGRAIAVKASSVAYAAHAGDHAVYPDCRPEFADAIDAVARVCDYDPLTVRRPFIDKSKADIVGIGADLGVPFDMTWSCYNGRELHCGLCGTCVERKEAFALADVEDPTEYET